MPLLFTNVANNFQPIILYLNWFLLSELFLISIAVIGKSLGHVTWVGGVSEIVTDYHGGVRATCSSKLLHHIELHGIVFFCIVSYCVALRCVELNHVESHCIAMGWILSYPISSYFICIFNASDHSQCIRMCIVLASVMEMHVPIL